MLKNYCRLKTIFPTITDYTLDNNKDYVEFGFPIFRSRIDRDTGITSHIYLIVKHGPKVNQLRKFFQKNKVSIQQPDGTFLEIRNVALDYYFGIGKIGYEDVSMGKEPNLNIDELNFLKNEIKAKRSQK